MIKKGKRSLKENNIEEPSAKVRKVVDNKKINSNQKNKTETQNNTVKNKDFKNKDEKNFSNKNFKNKPTGKFNKNSTKPFKKNFEKKDSKPPNWIEFKKKQKEVQQKRKQNKSSYDVMIKAKKIGELLRRKTLKGGEEERTKLCAELHELLIGNYAKLVMTHDIARVIQQLLKFGTEKIQNEITDELKTVVVEMIQSKYAKYCIKNILANRSIKIRSTIIEACYGNVVKLTSHAVSADIFNTVYSTASQLQKHHLLQEFFGDIYKQSKDDSVKHLKDVYEKSPDMKTAALGATKANLQRILNKSLLDSHLVQTVLMQFLQECVKEDRSELISQLASHVVILSNSKEGVRVVMTCIWHGTNKDRKVVIKTLKEHVLPLSKHEHGYCSIITAIDSSDDTLLVNKALLTEIVKNATELAADEWGRKVLLWLVGPGNTAYFHPVFINELKKGRENSECKKDADVRYKEILNYSVNGLLQHISEQPEKWLSNNCFAIVTTAVLKAANGEDLKKAFEALTNLITKLDWKVKEGEKEILGIEHAGIHMNLKKIIEYDNSEDSSRPRFGSVLVEQLNDEIINLWIQYNRGCYILVKILETNSEAQNKIIELLRPHKKLLKKVKTSGSKILLEKLK